MGAARDRVRRTLRAVALVLAAAALALTGGCIVRMDSPPPWLGMKPAGTSTTATPQPAASRTATPTAFTAYLVEGGHLVAVPRGGAAARTTPEEAMRILLEGPTAAERKAGITSAIPAGTRLNSADVDFYRTARVDLSREFATGGTSASAQYRIAQVVYTLTQLPGVAAVQFYFDGRKAQRLGSERIDMMQPKSRADFPHMAP